MLSSGSAVAAVALVDEAVGDDGGTAAGMGKRGGIIGWSDGGWLAIVSRVVVGRWALGRLVGRALGRLVGRLNGWLAGGLISGGWVSVSWLVGWLAVGGGWAVRVVESAESSGAVGSAAVDARALGLQEDVSESRSSTETGDGRWKDVRATAGVVVLELVVEVGCSWSGAGCEARETLEIMLSIMISYA